MIHHCNSFITTKSFSLYVILIDLDEVLTRVPRGHTQCIPSANLPELIEPFNPFCCVQEILRLGISKTIYLYYQDIWYFKQTCLHSSFLAVCKNKAITASLGSLTLPIYNGKKSPCSSSCCSAKFVFVGYSRKLGTQVCAASFVCDFSWKHLVPGVTLCENNSIYYTAGIPMFGKNRSKGCCSSAECFLACRIFTPKNSQL